MVQHIGFDRFQASSHWEEYLGSTRSKYVIEKKYNITQGLIKDWLRKLGLEDKILPEQMMGASPNSKSDLTPDEKEELKQLAKRIVS